MLDRFFGLSRHGTSVRTELWAGLTTFLTMAYIIFLQPTILSGQLSGQDTGMDFYAVTVATCVSAAVATAIMALYARYPIAQAPGMGENFFFLLTVLPAAAAMIRQQTAAGTLAPGDTSDWQVALGVVFLSGVLFLLFSLCGLRQVLLDTTSPSMRHAMAGGIGLFIAFIGLHNSGLIVILRAGRPEMDTLAMNHQLASPDLVVFFFGLLLTAGLCARRVPGGIFWGIVAAAILSVAFKEGLSYAPQSIAQSEVVTKSMLIRPGGFEVAGSLVSQPPLGQFVRKTFFKLDVVRALSWPMIPLVLIFLFMVIFDTLGTLVAVAERAGLMKDNQLPRARQAFLSDAAGSVVGAVCGTSTVTSFIESTAGVEQGGRTGLTALTTAGLFVLALFFSPLIKMVGSYPPITAPALVVVGSMMMRSIAKIEWSNFAEAMPAFLIVVGIPLSYSIADGLALGFISYPIVKLISGQGRGVKWPMYVIAAVLVAYFAAIRSQTG
jgi:AGZA family xanthine/uracil permease-like MFS transporter